MKRRSIARFVCAATAFAGGPAFAGAIQSLPEAAKEAGDKLDFAAYDALLKKYVDGKGRVDYAKLRGQAQDRRQLERLYAQVAAQKLDVLPSKVARLAFLIDAYNIVVWKNVLDHSPKQVDEGLYKFFRRDYVVAGREIDLDGLEKKWIRKDFKDGRVHFALNCASGGCPALPNEAFTPEKVEAQLEREAKKFCNEARNVTYDATKKTAKLSMIFKWYSDDFGGKALEFVNQRRAADQKIPADAKVDHVDYDWHLNDPSLAR